MTSNDRDKLTDALKRAFEARDVEAEPVGPNGRYRFAVVSPRFGAMTQLDRQDATWAVVDEILPREATLDVSLILAFAPEELEPTV